MIQIFAYFSGGNKSPVGYPGVFYFEHQGKAYPVLIFGTQNLKGISFGTFALVLTDETVPGSGPGSWGSTLEELAQGRRIQAFQLLLEGKK